MCNIPLGKNPICCFLYIIKLCYYLIFFCSFIVIWSLISWSAGTGFFGWGTKQWEMLGQLPEAISSYCGLCICTKGVLEFKYLKVVNHGIYGWCTRKWCEDHSKTWNSTKGSCKISKFMDDVLDVKSSCLEVKYWRNCPFQYQEWLTYRDVISLIQCWLTLVI